MIFQSIKWRILAWNFALLVVVVAVLLTAFYRHECENRLQMSDVRLRQAILGAMPELHHVVSDFPPPRRANANVGEIARPAEASGMQAPPEDPLGYGPAGPPAGGRFGLPGGPPPPPPGAPGAPGAAYLAGAAAGRADPLAGRREVASRSREVLDKLERGPIWCAVISGEGAAKYRSLNAPHDFTAFADAIAATPESPDGDSESVVERSRQRALIHRHPSGFTVLIGTSVDAHEADSLRLALMLSASGAFIVGAGCYVGWILAGRSLRPIDKITETAEKIAAGDFRRTIDVSETESELGRLAVVLNTTFANLNDAREQVIRFTADASHELRTPLSVILANSRDALRRDRSTEEYRESIESTERAAKRMKSLSDDLLELARGGAGREALQTFPCDLADLADETVAMLEPLAKQHGATLTATLESCPVEVDPVRFGRAVVNLVSNAILHNGPGVKIAVRLRAVGDRALLEVVDTGKGIAPEHLDRIFDRFHRADASRSRNTGGSGLGLAIVRQTVEMHGGTIEVKSVVGSGAVFVITLPLRSR